MTVDHPTYEVVVIGAGVAGIYQIKRLLDLGVHATVLEGSEDIGGTWYWNRYPGCRFDSESYSYGYSFSRELLDEWHWKERFSPQPENLRYLNYVVDKFDLRRAIQFNSRVERMVFDESSAVWRLEMVGDRVITTRFVITGMGMMSAPTLPSYEGIDSFKGQAFHTFYWPHEPIDLAGKRVGVIGTGASGIQVISEIADKVGHLSVFQRRPNWAAPLHNGPISDEEMAEIRANYDDIFALCARTPGNFVHDLDRRGFYNLTREERVAFWDDLYETPGFAILLRNFVEILTEEEANAEFSEYIADRIRQRVKDPAIAEKLIPKDHGFGVQRIPMETNYFEVYNRGNVRLVDISESPIERITENGILTSTEQHELDVIVFATGFDAVTGAFDRVDIRGVGGRKLRDKWADGPITFLGMLSHDFPNLLMLSGPQSGSASTNIPRAIEVAVDWTTKLLEHVRDRGHTRFDATAEAEQEWTAHVAERYHAVLMHKATKHWLTGYNSNIEGREHGKPRYLVYNGGAPKYVKKLNEVTANDYDGIDLGSNGQVYVRNDG